MLVSTFFTSFVTSDIHQWNGFDWFGQSWQWHWCMPSLHFEWYYATNVHFYFWSSVEASSPLKVLSFTEIYWNLWRFMKHVGFCEWQLNWNEELYNMENKLLKCKWILSYHWTCWNSWCMWVFLVWQLNWNEEPYNMDNKLWN